MPCSIGGNSASPLNSAVTPAGSTASRTASCTATTRSRSSVVDDTVELGLRVRDAAVVREGVLVERVADARDAGVAVRIRPGRRELVGLELRDRGLDRRLALGRVEPLALRAPRRRGSGRRPAPRRTPTRSGRSPSGCPSRGSRTRPSGCRRRSPTRTISAAMIPTQARRPATGASRRRASSARARRSRVARARGADRPCALQRQAAPEDSLRDAGSRSWGVALRRRFRRCRFYLRRPGAPELIGRPAGRIRGICAPPARLMLRRRPARRSPEGRAVA